MSKQLWISTRDCFRDGLACWTPMNVHTSLFCVIKINSKNKASTTADLTDDAGQAVEID
jgi:hypothetical protein